MVLVWMKKEEKEDDFFLFFLLRILSIFNTHGEREEGIKETNSAVYPKGLKKKKMMVEVIMGE